MRTLRKNREMRVLVVDDDRAVRDALRRVLTLADYEVQVAEGGAEAIEAVAQSVPDAVVLDIGLPDIDGLEVCERLRRLGNRVPVLMLTARVEVSDRVAGLDAGADDYLSKPFAVDELLARLRALVRRATFDENASEIVVADLRIDESARRAWRGDRELELTKTEFDLLHALATNAGIVLSHSRIYDIVWGYDFGPESKSLAVYVGYLRRKTEEGGEPRLIHTVRAVGYTLRAP